MTKKLLFRQKPTLADKALHQDVFWLDVATLNHLLETGHVVTLDAVSEEEVPNDEA